MLPLSSAWRLLVAQTQLPALAPALWWLLGGCLATLFLLLFIGVLVLGERRSQFLGRNLSGLQATAVFVLGAILLFACLWGFIFSSLLAQTRAAQATATIVAAATQTATAQVTTTPMTTTVNLRLRPRTPTPVPLPSSCALIKAQNPGAADGEYTLYLGGNANAPASLYCHNMIGTPAEYLTLAQTGDGFNYSLISYPEGALATHYQKLRLNPSSLIVDRSDMTFATPFGAVPGYVSLSEAEAGRYPFASSDYAAATGCNRGVADAPPGQANIDLTGTPFRLSADTTFTAQGGEVTDPISSISDDGKTATLSVNGRCGIIQPAEPLQFIYESIP